MEGDEELLHEVVQIFLEDSPRLRSEIQIALERQDADGLRRAAYTLKGSAANFSASAAVSAAMELESLAQLGDLNEAGRAFAYLEKTLAQLCPALAGLGRGMVRRLQSQ